MCDVTVVMPVRNGEPYVSSAVESVLACTSVALELLVVDDGSTDRTRSIVRARSDPRVRIIDGPENVVADAMTLAVREARGHIVMRCDADDCYPGPAAPSLAQASDDSVGERIAWQSHWLKAHPGFVAVCGGFSIIDPRGKQVSNVAMHDTPAEITEELKYGQARTHLCTYAIRREAAMRTLPFRNWFQVADDVDFQFRLAEVGRVWYEPAVTYCYRVHDNSLTHQRNDARRVFEDESARRFALQRRRQGADDLQKGEPPKPPAGDGENRTGAASQLQKIVLGRAWQECATRGRMAGIKAGLKACWMRPASVVTWANVLVLAVRGVR